MPAGRKLLWIQAGKGLYFELRAGDEVAGRLRWERLSLAGGEMAGQRWTFKREGFWHPRVTVRVQGSESNVALFQPNWTTGGTLELEAGRKARFGTANFWAAQWDWIDESGLPLVHFQNHGKGFKLEAQVVIEDHAEGSRDMPLFVVLGWYLLVLSSLEADSGGG